MMKALLTAVLLISIIGNIGAIDIDSHLFIEHIRSISSPRGPEIYGNGVIFTAPSHYRRVGISFAHENYARVHWFRPLLLPRDTAELYVDGRRQRNVDPHVDSGIMFHLEMIPESLSHMDYRLIIDGLWTVDPFNPVTVTGPSGLTASRISLPPVPETEIPPAPGTFRFNYRASPGEVITVGGDFNNWDPFMYELRETSPGFFTLTLPLPPGPFQYVFFHRGSQIPDPSNHRQVFNRQGRSVSEGLVR